MEMIQGFKGFFHPTNRRLLYEELTDAAVDPYAAVKDVYIQHREKKVRE